MVDASEIFFGFCRNFSGLGINYTNVDLTASTWKYRIYYFFDTLGRLLGYDVITEDTYTKKDGIKELIGKRIDMTWREPNTTRYTLAFEYENGRNIDGDIMKLAAMSCFRVLVMFRFRNGGFTDEEIINKITSENKKYVKDNNEFLVLILPQYFEYDKPPQEFKGLLIDWDGNVNASGTALGYTAKDMTCSLRDIQWKSQK